MAIIPKLNVGVRDKRERHNWSFDNSTTANVGQVQPTMCREMIKGETVKVKVSSFVRLSPLAVPTFGRMSLRHHHFFVPYSLLWDRFNSFLAGMPVTPFGANSYIPEVPFFSQTDIVQHAILYFSDISLYKKSTRTGIVNSDSFKDCYEIVDASSISDVSAINTALTAFWNLSYRANSAKAHYMYRPDLYIGFTKQDPSPNSLGLLVTPTFFAGINYQRQQVVLSSPSSSQVLAQRNSSSVDSDSAPVVPVVDWEGADFSFRFGSNTDKDEYICLGRYKPILKRFRTFMKGLGYAFTSVTDNSVTYDPWKMMAFYMAWYQLFAPQREKGFEQTSLYQLIDFLHQNRDGTTLVGNNVYFTTFMYDCMKMCYYLPMDYFSMSLRDQQQQFQETLITSNSSSPDVKVMGEYDDDVYSNGTSYAQIDSYAAQAGSFNLQLLRFMERLLPYTNKNSVIGRNLRSYLKAHGLSVTDNAVMLNGVHYLGSSRVNIVIDDVMSMAETSEGFLGEYAGKGKGMDKSQEFSVTAPEYGVYITLSVIVPESGYCQGYLRENRHRANRLDYPQVAFDALGYEVLERGELVNDYCSDIAPLQLNPASYSPTYAFGFNPRYSYHKVSKNILNGDLSVPSLANSMGSYALDRLFPTKPSYTGHRYFGYRNSFMPSLVFDNFRAIDLSDTFGNYNRIFNYTGVDVDHYIIHNVFDVVLISPLKSLSNSFDLYSENVDTDTTSISHE